MLSVSPLQAEHDKRKKGLSSSSAVTFPKATGVFGKFVNQASCFHTLHRQSLITSVL
jgi:hypothetical protein